MSRSTLKKLSLSLLLEFGPIFIFLFSFNYFQVYKATMLLMIATIITTIIMYRTQRRLPYVALYVAFITIAFGYLTLAHKEPKFIQMRDTLYDLTCALTLLVGQMINVPFMKIAFHDVIPMSMRAWNKLTYAWIAFFITIATLNEYMRRTHDLDTWFTFKSVIVFTTIVFGFVTLFIYYERDKH